MELIFHRENFDRVVQSLEQLKEEFLEQKFGMKFEKEIDQVVEWLEETLVKVKDPKFFDIQPDKVIESIQIAHHKIN